MITYIEKGYGLHETISAAGHWLAQSGGEWRSSDDVAVQAIIDSYTLDQAKAFRCIEIARHAKKIRDQVISDISAGEMSSWPIKLSESAKYAATGNAADVPMLSMEAQARGITLAELVAKVDDNATIFAGMEAMIAGVDGKHRDAIKACATFEEVASYDSTTGWPAI